MNGFQAGNLAPTLAPGRPVFVLPTRGPAHAQKGQQAICIRDWGSVSSHVTSPCKADPLRFILKWDNTYKR